MNGKIPAVLSLGLLFGCVQPPAAQTTAAPAPPPAVAAPVAAPAVPLVTPAPRNRRVSISGVRCEKLLELSEDDRAAAALFYIGYHAARFHARAIDVGAIPDAEAWAFNYCAARPYRPVVEAFRQAFVRNLQ